jgi:hypothetical protein
MKRINAVALFAIATLATIGSAAAQDRAVQAAVPFSFAVAGKTLPSGTYTITSESAGLIMIQDRATHAAVQVVTMPDHHESRNGGKLVFNRYGNQYFLSEILSPDAAVNVSIPASKQEKQVRLQEAELKGGETVLVALK